MLSAIVPLITNFYLHVKKQGTVTISNGKNVKTNLSVVKIDTCELDPLTTNTIRVRHVMNIETLDYNLVIKPEDIDHAAASTLLSTNLFYSAFIHNRHTHTHSVYIW